MAVVVNIIPKYMSGEANQDSEPNLAVNPNDPRLIVATAFTPDLIGGTKAPIFVSTDGGDTWNVNPILPSQSGKSTQDITLRFASRSNNLYIGMLSAIDGKLNVLRMGNPTGGTTVMLENRDDVDQPFVEATTTITEGSRLYWQQ